jgi:hypothetical protein
MSSSAQVAVGQEKPLPTIEPKNVRSRKHIPPMEFITDFVRKCFTEDLCEVDFTQSLTAMEYLRILEDQRRNEITAAIRRLSVEPRVLDRDRQNLQNNHPGISEWISSMEDKSRKVEALYTQVYVGLRRWVSQPSI